MNAESKKTGKTKKKAAIAKKGRFNILRIYRKNKKVKECNIITHDMKYMDRKYGLGKQKIYVVKKAAEDEQEREREKNSFYTIQITHVNRLMYILIKIQKILFI